MQRFDLVHHSPELGLFSLIDHIRQVKPRKVSPLVPIGWFVGSHCHVSPPYEGGRIQHPGEGNLLNLAYAPLVSDQITIGGTVLDVGGECYHVQVVDLPELLGLGGSGPCHPRQFLVHTEIVLEGDSGVGQTLAPHRHTLFSLNRLVQPLRVAPAV